MFIHMITCSSNPQLPVTDTTKYIHIRDIHTHDHSAFQRLKVCSHFDAASFSRPACACPWRRRRHFHTCVCACTSKGGINAKASVKRHAIPGFLKQKSMSIAYHCSTFKSLLRKPKPICDFCLTNLACLSACLSSVVKIIVHWKVLTFVFVDFQNEEHLVDYLVMALLALQVDQSTSHLSRSARCTQGLHLKSYR